MDKGYAVVSTYGDSLVMGYSSVTDYNSTINRHLADFYNMLYTRAKVTDAQRIVVYSEESEVCPMSLINLNIFYPWENWIIPGVNMLVE